MKIGLISFSDRDQERSAAHYENLSAEIQRVVSSIFMAPSEYATALIPCERKQLTAEIIRLCDEEKCPLVLTLGGAGPALADIVPDVTRSRDGARNRWPRQGRSPQHVGCGQAGVPVGARFNLD